MVKPVVQCMVITRLNKWFGIELYCVSTDRVSDLAAVEWFGSQRLTTGYLVVDMKPDRIREDVPLFPETSIRTPSTLIRERNTDLDPQMGPNRSGSDGLSLPLMFVWRGH